MYVYVCICVCMCIEGWWVRLGTEEGENSTFHSILKFIKSAIIYMVYWDCSWQPLVKQDKSFFGHAVLVSTWDKCQFSTPKITVLSPLCHFRATHSSAQGSGLRNYSWYCLGTILNVEDQTWVDKASALHVEFPIYCSCSVGGPSRKLQFLLQGSSQMSYCH